MPGSKKDPSEPDKRHGDPDYGGITSGEKSALSRGYRPQSIDESKEKAEGAERYLHDKAREGGSKKKK